MDRPGRTRSSPLRRLPGVLGLLGLSLAFLAAAAPAFAGHAAPSLPPPVLTVPSLVTAADIDLGMYLNVSVNASQITGGSGNVSNYTYTWSGLPTNCTSANVFNYSCLPTEVGTFQIYVHVVDSGTAAVGSSPVTNVTVNTDPVISSLTVSASSVGVNGTVTFTTTASGGTAPLTYAYAGLPTGCEGNTSSFSCQPTAAQTYNVTVTVTDAVGMAAAQTPYAVVQVTAATTSSSPHPTLVEWGIIAAILVVGLGISGALFVRARREERRSYATPRSPPGPGGSAPPPAPPPGASG